RRAPRFRRSSLEPGTPGFRGDDAPGSDIFRIFHFCQYSRARIRSAGVARSRPASLQADRCRDRPRQVERQVLQDVYRFASGRTAPDDPDDKAIGIDRYIAEQLDPDSSAEPPELTE